MSGITDIPTSMGTAPPLEELAALLVYREPRGLAREALSILLVEFGATAGSIFYTTRPPLRVRRGDLSRAHVVHIDRWEAEIKERIAAGPWEFASHYEPRPAWQPVQGSPHVAAHSLILHGQQVAGTICLIFSRERVPTGSERTLLTRCLRVAGNMVSLVSELALTKQRMSQLSLFYQVAQVMASTFDLDRVLGDILELATAILDASASALMMIDEKEGDLVCAHAHGERGDLYRRRTALGRGLAGWVAVHGEPLLANDIRTDPRFDPAADAPTGLPMHSALCVPIQIRGKTIGVLEALNKRSELGFDQEDISLMITTANQAAIAIETNQLYQSLREERDRIIQAQENVRRQVARNLHDGTVQFLSAISMGIDHMERLLQFKPEAARSELEALRDLTRQATQQARLALFELRPIILETQGLVPALEAYVEQLQNSEDFDIRLHADDKLPHLNNSVAATVFAIVQEAVNNAKKHADPTKVWLRLTQEDDSLQVVVQDNGTGFELETVEREYDRRGSIGLLSMRERADLIDGVVEIESSTEVPHAGTSIILRVAIPSTGKSAAT